MIVDEIRARLRERIKRGATFDELETVIRMSRGLRQQERSELWSWAWSYDPDAEKPRRGPGPGLRPRVH